MVPSEAQQFQRIIDASLNRIGEGLRFLEELARFILNDAALTEQVKTLRHSLLRGDRLFHQQLLQARNATGDVGAATEIPEESQRDLPLAVVANSRRAQESLRTLEELAKLPGLTPRLDSEKYRKARFDLYTLEQLLLARLLRQDKAKRITGLYVVLDTASLGGRSPIGVASQAINGGARTVQLRDKTSNRKALLALATQMRTLCREHEVLFMVNDYLDLALAADTDGVHVGQEDLPVGVARRLMPIDKIVGCSASTVGEALAAQAEGADYIAVGAIYPTPSKKDIEVVGLERLRQIRRAVDLPLVAIGGINVENAVEVAAAGADSVAVISAVLQADSPEEAARQISSRLEVKTGQ